MTSRFQIPLAVKVYKVEWSANGGFGGAPAEWLIPARASTTRPPVTGGDPWSIVSTFFQGITLRDYAAAWKLLGPTLQSSGYTRFAAGYSDTGKQTVTKISQSGDQVSFTLQSDNPDGTVQMYQGTDTVSNGKIVAAHIVQTG